MIEFKDVTGDVIGRPGDSFFKMDSISDEAIAAYLERGAEIVKMDDVSHAHALKLRTAKELFNAKQSLSNVPAEQPMEDIALARVRAERKGVVEKAAGADKLADHAVKKAKTKAAKPRKKKND